MSKYKIIKDFQLTTDDKKIITLKAKLFINDFKYESKDGSITLDPLVVEQNPDYFQFIDWKQDFINYLKVNKIPQPSIVAKKIFPYIEENFNVDSIKEIIKEIIVEKPIEKIVEVEKIVIDEKANKQLTKELAELKITNLNLTSKYDSLAEDKAEIEYRLSEADLIIQKVTSEKANKKTDLSKLEGELVEKVNKVNERLLELNTKEEGLRFDNISIAETTLKNSEDRIELDKLKEKLNKLEFELAKREDDVIRKNNTLNARERELKAIDVETIVKKAIDDYEKTIPWQYHRKNY